MIASARAGVPLFDLSIGELLVIAVLILVFVGPDRIPELMSVAGRYYGKFRRMSDDLRRTFNAEVARHESDRRREELETRRKEIEAKRREERDAARDAASAAEAEAPAAEPASADVADATTAPVTPDGSGPETTPTAAQERPLPPDAVARPRASEAGDP